MASIIKLESDASTVSTPLDHDRNYIEIYIHSPLSLDQILAMSTPTSKTSDTAAKLRLMHCALPALRRGVRSTRARYASGYLNQANFDHTAGNPVERTRSDRQVGQ